MTHDELMAKIDHYYNLITSGDIWTTDVFIKALRAIVELHKPGLIPDWVPTDNEYMCWCAHVYPCPTIQAIEKEIV